MEEKVLPLFVGGSGRSGTTIAINLLNQHSQFHASLPREIKYLTSRFGLLELIYGRPISIEENLQGKRNNLVSNILPLLGRSKLQSFQSYLGGSWWSEVGKAGKPRGLSQAISKEVLESTLVQLLQNFKGNPHGTARSFFYSLASAQIKKPGVKIFADSTPVNIMHANNLNNLFPEARFLNMVRDGRDVALSVSKEKWGPNDPYQGLEWWANRVLKGARSLEKITSANKLELRLEDLVKNDRTNSYSKLLGFLEITDEVKLKEYFESEVGIERLHEGQWKTSVNDPAKFEEKYQQILNRLKASGVSVERFY